MTIRDDLDKPLPDVENTILRRFVVIIMGVVVVLPLTLVHGLFIGIKCFWTEWVRDCW